MMIFSVSVCTEAVNQDLYDEEILSQAQGQILSMQTAELDEFREYLASCGTVAGGETKHFFCERSARSYILKYGQDKPLEKIILALAEVEFLVDLVDEAEEKDQIKGEEKESMKRRVFKDLDRYIVIRKAFEDTIRKAYQEKL